MKHTKKIYVIIIMLIFLGISACSESDSGNGGTGTLSLSLTDVSTDRYRAIYVTIDEIQVHMGGSENSPGNWTSVDMPESPMTLDLLQLINGVRENLGQVSLPAGRYTQMRMLIGNTPENALNTLEQNHPHANYVIDQTSPGTAYELKVPSGFNSGVKIVNGFTIDAEQTTELVLDFDASRSVVEAGNSGHWQLKPTIKVADLQEYSIILGNVSDAEGALEGAMVSVQTFDSSATDPMDKVMVETSTITDEFGDYTIFVQADEYHLVAYQSGKEAAFTNIAAQAGMVLDTNTDFTLVDTVTTGTVTGDVTVSGADVDHHATISFRKEEVAVDTTRVDIEIISINIMNGSAFNLSLPTGTYKVVASSSGHSSAEYSILVTADASIERDINF